MLEKELEKIRRIGSIISCFKDKDTATKIIADCTANILKYREVSIEELNRTYQKIDEIRKRKRRVSTQDLERVLNDTTIHFELSALFPNGSKKIGLDYYDTQFYGKN